MEQLRSAAGRSGTIDSQWRSRVKFPKGREEIIRFLTRKRVREQAFRIIKELWAHENNRIAVRFVYEWHDYVGNWLRSYGNENWEFDADGLVQEAARQHQQHAHRGTGTQIPLASGAPA